ncbi:MAG: DNA translocase FtsK [SAR202 cluster bacterium]|nr:DNA translocase FtsK [SAR202 cluster bacterium]
MPRPSRQIRRSVEPPSREKSRPRPASVADGLVVMLFVAVAVVALAVSGAARQWAISALGYGWAPVLVWTAALLATLRYRPGFVFRHWRPWLLSATAVAASIMVLAYFYPNQGPMSDTSLGGRWGNQMIGTPPALGLARLAALVFITPAVLYPRRIGLAYLGAMHHVGATLRSSTLRVAGSQRRRTRPLSRRLKLLSKRRFWRYWLRWVWGLLSGWFGRKVQLPASRPAEQAVELLPEDEGPAAAKAGFSKESAGLWDQVAPGTIPQLDTTPVPVIKDTGGDSGKEAAKPVHIKSKWKLPPATSILAPPEPHNVPQAPLQQMARLIESTMSEHGVIVEVKDIKAGPRVVRFGLVPGWINRKGEGARGEGGQPQMERSRVKVQAILTREKDLALALKTPYLRIEAPVPGEALVGLEVPNPLPSKVPLRAVMDNQAFRKLAAKGSSLPLALGQDTAGTPVALDLAALPHVLIAGATGSGKSVCINSIVASLLLTRPPDQVRMLMVDPKRVELTPFNRIPHLIAPVIVEVDEVNPALRAVMREMFRRYKQMEEVGTRNIVGYNAKAKDRMPYLVVIVDELADLMMTGGFEIEQNLVRLAQLGRATGIHLVLATQRPSVNVVTGLLKANIAARVAFAVASQVDSRVILDTVGAEKLLGKGDMLLLSNDSPKPRRVQGALVLDEEIDEVVKFWLEQKGPPLPIIPIDDPEEEEKEGDDVDERTLEQARELALRNPRLSSSLLERRLKVGSRKADQIMDALEDEGLVVAQR